MMVVMIELYDDYHLKYKRQTIPSVYLSVRPSVRFSVRPELVEGSAGFDRLSPNGRANGDIHHKDPP